MAISAINLLLGKTDNVALEKAYTKIALKMATGCFPLLLIFKECVQI